MQAATDPLDLALRNEAVFERVACRSASRVDVELAIDRAAVRVHWAQQQRNGLRDRKTLEREELRVVRVNGREMNMARTARYETPTFDPRGAFSWTLRAGEIAGRERQQRRHRLPDPKQLGILVAS
jgi:hypothetical protein